MWIYERDTLEICLQSCLFKFHLPTDTDGTRLHCVTLWTSVAKGETPKCHFCYVVVLLHILFSASNFFEIKIATWTQSFGSWEFDQSVWLMCDQKFAFFSLVCHSAWLHWFFIVKGKGPLCVPFSWLILSVIFVVAVLCLPFCLFVFYYYYCFALFFVAAGFLLLLLLLLFW